MRISELLLAYYLKHCPPQTRAPPFICDQQDSKNSIFFSDEKTKRRIFNIHTSKMTLADDVNVEEYIMSKDDLSGADIKAICTEAGLMALR